MKRLRDYLLILSIVIVGATVALLINDYLIALVITHDINQLANTFSHPNWSN